MSFYMSESLQGRITEEDLLEKPVVKKTNFTEKMYLCMTFQEGSSSSNVFVPIISLNQEEEKSIIEYTLPEDALLFKKSLSIASAHEVKLFISNKDSNSDDEDIFNFKNKEIKVVSVRQSLLGYNYVATIVINNCTVF